MSPAALLLVALAVAAPPQTPEVKLLHSRACGEAQCHALEVSCQGLAPRKAQVREHAPAEGPSRGTLVLTTGVWGNKAYHEEPERLATLEAARKAGFEVFELWWPARHGWGFEAEGAGFGRTLCAPTAAIRWLVAERADAPGRVCAQGNSGGALQIAYGLSLYQLDDILHLAVLSGGPPLVDMAGFCFDRQRERAKMWRQNGRRIIDTLQGWDGKGDYCKNAEADPAAIVRLEADSLVRKEPGTAPRQEPGTSPRPARQEPGTSPRPARQEPGTVPRQEPGTVPRQEPGTVPRQEPGTVPLRHHFETRVVFVESEGDKSTRQARLYHDALAGPKRWLELPSRAHGVDRTPETAATLRRVLIEECGAVAADTPGE